jgi:CheY-like chemotaxis protein
MKQEPLRSFAPATILIVDDDPVFQEILVSHFESLGFTVQKADTGLEALTAMEHRLPDVVICDRIMPEMSGAELLRAIRERDEVWQKVAFIFSTVLSDQRDISSMMLLKPDAYICKPFDLDSIDAELARVLSKKGREEPPA